MNYIYSSIITSNDDETEYRCQIPDLPDCQVTAPSVHQAIKEINETASKWLVEAEKKNNIIPAPTPQSEIEIPEKGLITLVAVDTAVYRCETEREFRIGNIIPLKELTKKISKNININEKLEETKAYCRWLVGILTGYLVCIDGTYVVSLVAEISKEGTFVATYELLMEWILLVAAVLCLVFWAFLSSSVSRNLKIINNRIEKMAKKKVRKILKSKAGDAELESKVDAQVARLHSSEIDPDRDSHANTVATVIGIVSLAVTVAGMFADPIKEAFLAGGGIILVIGLIIINVILGCLTSYINNKVKKIDKKVVRRKICDAAEKWLLKL